MSNKNWKKRMEVEKANSDGCCGWKTFDQCPNDGKFNPNHPVCKECEEDALNAMDEAYRLEANHSK